MVPHVAARNNYAMSISYFLLFVCYYTGQNFATSLDATFGPISLGILYVMWTISLLTISSAAVNHLTPKYSMFIGSLAYPMYVAAGMNLATNFSILIYMVLAVLVGVGGGLLWVGQGVLIVQCAMLYEADHEMPKNSKLGSFNGIFNFFLNKARFVGSLTAALIFQLGGSLRTLVVVMVSIGACGSFTFLCIRPLDLSKLREGRPAKTSSRRNVGREGRGIGCLRGDDNTGKHGSGGGKTEGGLVSVDYTQEETEDHMVEHSEALGGEHGHMISMEHVAENAEGGLVSVDCTKEETEEHVVEHSEVELGCEHVQSKSSLESSASALSSVSMLRSFTASQFHSGKDEIVAVWKQKVFMLLIPIGISSGLTQTFVASEYATMLKDHSLKFYALAVEAFVTSLGSMAFGRAADKCGSLYLTVFSCAVFVGVCVFLFFWTVEQDDVGAWFALAVFLGIGEAGHFTLVPQLFTILLGDDNAVVASMRILQATGFCVGFAYYPVTPPVFRLSFNVMVAAVSGFLLLVSGEIREALGPPRADSKESQ